MRVDIGELLGTRLAYAFRPAASLGRLSFDGDMVAYRSRKCPLTLPPVEFLARLTLHIPDRYQDIRRYAGFYSSVVQRRIRAARKKNTPATLIDEGRPAEVVDVIRKKAHTGRIGDGKIF